MEPSSFNETPEGKPLCSMTYLAGEEEALAKRKGKTLYTHKSHGCGLGGRFSLFHRQGIETGKAGERVAHTEEVNNMWRQRRNLKKKRNKKTYPKPILGCFNLSTTTTPQPKAQNTKERWATSSRQKIAIKRNKNRTTYKNKSMFLHTD